MPGCPGGPWGPGGPVIESPLGPLNRKKQSLVEVYTFLTLAKETGRMHERLFTGRPGVPGGP